MTLVHRRWAARVAVAGGSVAAAVLVGHCCTAVALADGGDATGTVTSGVLDGDVLGSAAPHIVTSYPLELLQDASANLTDANHVLVGAVAEVAGMTQQTAAQNIALDELASLYTAESSLSSYDSAAFADLLNPWFTLVDQGWDHGTEAVLSADQAVAEAVAAGTGVDTAVLGVFAADFQLAGDMLNSFPIELLAGFTDPAGFADLLAP